MHIGYDAYYQDFCETFGIYNWCVYRCDAEHDMRHWRSAPQNVGRKEHAAD